MVLCNKKIQTKGYRSEGGKENLLLIWGIKDDIMEDVAFEVGLEKNIKF